MICAYLLHSGLKTTASEVLEYYAKQRTQDQKGVTIPSQKRYVDYYSTLITNSLQYNPVKMYLTSIVIDPLPNLGQGRQEGYIQVASKRYSLITRERSQENISFLLDLNAACVDQLHLEIQLQSSVI